MSNFRRKLMYSKTPVNIPDYASLRGVFIEDIDGNLYTESEWSGNKVPNGIAVITDDCRFVIALEDAEGSHMWDGSVSSVGDCPSGGTLIDSVVSSSEEATIVEDFNGKENTGFIVYELGDYGEAANACYNFYFPNGKRGYLGSAGEWNSLHSLVDKIQSALQACAGDEISGYKWVSAQSATCRAWTYAIETGTFYSQFKDYNYPVRPFTKLKYDNTGVYIEDVTGELLNITEWNESVTVNGIAVIDDKCRFVVAKTDISDYMKIYAPAFVPELVGIDEKSEAALDFNGKENTDRIIEIYGNDSIFAAGACASYSFPSGVAGYLGSAGEWTVLGKHKRTVNGFLTYVSDDKLNSETYWTSTYRTDKTFWMFYKDGYIAGANMTYPYYVRAFAPLVSDI